VGVPVGSDLDRRVLGISVEQIRAIERRIGVAGGSRKLPAIRAALLGRWINVLVTDAASAEHLVDAAPS
jgi:DNA-binding transcriptional regulator LsrR (DeoR family)